MSADPESVVQRLYEEVWNKRKIQILGELVSPSHSLNVPSPFGSAVGPEAYKQVVASFMIGFPDFRFVVEDIITDKNKVVCRWTFSGTHKGEYRGVPATNKKVSVDGITIHHLTDGRIMDTYSSWDVWGLMQQLGVVRELGQPRSVPAR